MQVGIHATHVIPPSILKHSICFQLNRTKEGPTLNLTMFNLAALLLFGNESFNAMLNFQNVRVSFLKCNI